MSSAPENTEILPLSPPPERDLSLLDQWAIATRIHRDRTAIASPNQSYTFGEADELSTIVAARLVRLLPDHAAPVGLMLGHDAHAVVALLAILKAGRAAVFLDPHLPAERLAEIGALAAITACVSDRLRLPQAGTLGGKVTVVLDIDEIERPPEAHLTSSVSPPVTAVGEVPRGGSADAVSIVFTSGSSGRPKGVIQTNGQLVTDAAAHGARFRLGPNDRVALVLPYSFAAGFSLLFGALLNGASVWSYDPRDRGTRGLVSWIEDNHLTTLHCTPHLLRSVIGLSPLPSALESLRMVATVGEAIHGRDVEAIRAFIPPHSSFFNWTGSSEIGILATYEIPGTSPVPAGIIPAGRPVANREVVLVLENGEVAREGQTGEILTISDHLSAGYWRDDAANAARFSTGEDGRRICRQGDLGRFDENGDLVLLGRADAAIKVRGYLVEPSEIEGAFLSVAEVSEVVVVAVVDPPAPTRLVAYVVPRPGGRPESPAALRRALRLRLPEYMVPAAIVQLSALPRTERGKVDRAKLPPVPPHVTSDEPMNQWEIVIADIWSEVLGLDAVDLDDDFMALGGDSLSVEELLAIVRERFDVSLASTDLIDSATLRAFTRHVKLGSSSLPSHPDVATLNVGGSETPLFCFAGAGALALTFLPLSRHFPNRPVYAFQAHGLERRALPDWSVEAAARRYLEIMRVVRPHGPYILLGHSFGGLVALEIARQLTVGGEVVEVVGLLDTYLPRSAILQPEVSVVPLPSRPARSTPIRKIGRVVGKQVRRVLPTGIPALGAWNRHVRARLAGVAVYTGQRQFDAFFDHGIIAARKYHLPPYMGRAFMVVADRNPDARKDWTALLQGTLDFFDIRGDHSAFLREPHATQLAEFVSKALETEQSVPESLAVPDAIVVPESLALPDKRTRPERTGHDIADLDRMAV